MLLFFLSVYGAFIGADRAKIFFNSIPLAIYWLASILLLAVGIVLFKRLRRIPALLMIHIGCIFILCGAIWGSEAGHKINQKLFGIDKILSGLMVIYEDTSQNRVAAGTDEELGRLSFVPDQQGHIEYYLQDSENVSIFKHKELPFNIALKDFRIEYYQPHYLYVQSRQGDVWSFPVEVGVEYPLGDGLDSVKIIRIFENFKIGANRTITDDPNTGSNPALEVRLISPGGQELTRYVFEPSLAFIYSDDELDMVYSRSISDYISELQVIQDGKIVAEKDIEVNHPLHFGGYHFYQQSYDTETGRYTVLRIVSDTGLSTIYCGYILLCVGVVWQFWLKKISDWTIKHKAKRPMDGN